MHSRNYLKKSPTFSHTGVLLLFVEREANYTQEVWKTKGKKICKRKNEGKKKTRAGHTWSWPSDSTFRPLRDALSWTPSAKRKGATRPVYQQSLFCFHHYTARPTTLQSLLCACLFFFSNATYFDDQTIIYAPICSWAQALFVARHTAGRHTYIPLFISLYHKAPDSTTKKKQKELKGSLRSFIFHHAMQHSENHQSALYPLPPLLFFYIPSMNNTRGSRVILALNWISRLWLLQKAKEEKVTVSLGCLHCERTNNVQRGTHNKYISEEVYFITLGRYEMMHWSYHTAF